MGTPVTSDGSPIFHMVQSWGVASARHTSGCVVYPSSPHDVRDRTGGNVKNESDSVHPHSSSSSSSSQDSSECGIESEYLFDVPIGPSIIRWDFKTKRRLLQFQAHCDAMTSMRMSADRRFIATSCFSGEVKLWSPQWACLDHVTAPMSSQHHLAWSHDNRRFLIVGNGYNSSVVVYDIVCTDQDKSTPRLREAWRVTAGQPFDSPDQHAGHHVSGVKDKSCGGVQNTQEASPSTTATTGSKDSGLEYQYGEAFYMAEINPSGNVFAVEERPQRSTLTCLYSPSGELIRTGQLSVPNKDLTATKSAASASGSQEEGGESGQVAAVQTLLISTYKDGSYALVVQGGYVLFVDAEQLTITSSFKAGYSSRTCVWDGDGLVLPSDSGKLVWWSRTGDRLASFSVGSADYVVRLDWSVSGRCLWMCGFSTMTCLEVKKTDDGMVDEVKQRYVIPSHSIACCGVGFSPDGRSLASGDLAGNVWVTCAQDYTLKQTFTVAASVRCVAWWTNSVVLVGCLDGRVHECEVGGATMEVLHLEGSVLHMQFSHQFKLFAVGSSKGVLTIYDATSKENNQWKLITTFLAHPPRPGPQNARFGQLGIQAEIWSLCWSPHDNMVATSSEDQTTKIWNTSDWTCVATLHGHSMAVTSVDWKLIGQQNIIATCADDRTVRLTSGETFELIRIVDTKDIFGWHTLTYLSFQHLTSSSLLVCTTQNGHVVVWDCLTGERLARGKIHLGSIEGLAWQNEGDTLATVGADCIVNLFKLNLKPNLTHQVSNEARLLL